MITRQRPLVIIGLGAVALAVLFMVGQAAGLRINYTPSYPLGLWRIVPLAREAVIGDLVFICPPHTPGFERALERGYLRRGLCPGWLSPLIKTVVALPGQHIEIADVVTVDGRALAHSEIHPSDAAGRALDPYPGGIVAAGHLFLHSRFAGSYDSRYFGPLPSSGLLGLARPVVTFGS